MTKLFRTLTLVAVLTGAAGVNVTSAQDKNKPAKADKAKKGLVKVTESAKNGKFYFSVYTVDGKDTKYIAGGGAAGYETKDDVLKALEVLKAALESPKLEYVTKKADDKDDDKAEKKDKKKG